MATAAEVQVIYRAVLRTDLNATTAQAVADAINNGTTTIQQYQTSLVAQSAATTQAAIVVSSFITGSTGDSAKVDSLTAFAKTQNDYYTNVLKSSNAQLGAYEALGRAYASDATTSAAFAANYGALSTTDFINIVYGQAFGNAAPSAGALANLTAQVSYFTNLYTGAGIPAAQASLQAKGAVLGQILGYAVTADANNASNFDASAVARVEQYVSFAQNPGSPSPYSAPVSGVVGGPTTINVLTNETVSLDATAPLKSTAARDIVLGAITGGANINTAAGDDSIGTADAPLAISGASNVIDGSGGSDVLYATLGASLTGATSTTIANVEKVYLGSTVAAGVTVDTTKITGASELWSYKSAEAITFTNIAAGAAIGVEGTSAGSSTFTLANAGAATLLLKDVAGTGATSATGPAIDLTNATAVTLNVVSNSTATITAGSATTLAVTGAGNSNFTDVTLAGAWTSINASGATGSVGLGSLNASTVDTTVQLSAQNDYLTGLTLTASKNFTVTTGAGQDYISVAATGGGNVDTTLNTALVITDFTKGSDIIDLSAIATGDHKALTGSALAAIGAASNLQGAATAAATLLAAAGDSVAFGYAGSTYVLVNGGADALYNSGDTLVKLSGVIDVSVGAAGTNVLV